MAPAAQVNEALNGNRKPRATTRSRAGASSAGELLWLPTSRESMNHALQGLLYLQEVI